MSTTEAPPQPTLVSDKPVTLVFDPETKQIKAILADGTTSFVKVVSVNIGTPEPFTVTPITLEADKADKADKANKANEDNADNKANEDKWQTNGLVGCAQANDFEGVKWWIEQKGADIDMKELGGCHSTALQWAVYRENSEMTRYLLEKGANVNIVNSREQGFTALDYARQIENPTVQQRFVAMLTKKGAVRSPYYAIANNCYKDVVWWFENNVNTRSLANKWLSIAREMDTNCEILVYIRHMCDQNLFVGSKDGKFQPYLGQSHEAARVMCYERLKDLREFEFQYDCVLSELNNLAEEILSQVGPASVSIATSSGKFVTADGQTNEFDVYSLYRQLMESATTASGVSGNPGDIHAGVLMKLYNAITERFKFMVCEVGILKRKMADMSQANDLLRGAFNLKSRLVTVK